MSFLPIVQRELRTRARQWPTYWVRTIVGGFGTLLCVQQLEMGNAFGSASQAGQLAFQSLVVVAFIICSFGCLATSDSISSERREKTLGLLFLTRVRGADILLGKLASSALVMLCALVAFLPVLMIPVLAGGVAGGKAVRIGLMLIDTLMLSLAAGLLASTRHVQWFKSARAAVLLTIMLLVLPIVVQPVFHPLPFVGLLSPLYGATFADETGPAFWISLALAQLMVWLLFWRALVRIRWALKDADGETQSLVEQTRPEPSPHIAVAVRPHLNAGAQPIGWLLHRQRGIHGMIWAGAIFSLLFYSFRTFMPVFGGWTGSAWSLTWPLSFVGTVVSGGLFAWAASRFFFEARRSGELEMLVTTPVGAMTIVLEQWLFLRKSFRGPLAMMMLPILFQLPMAFFLQGNRFSGNSWMLLYMVGMVFNVLNFILGLVALCWTGMRFGLKSRTQSIAVFQTVAWVRGAPYLLSYGWMIILRAFMGGITASAYPTYMLLSWLPQIFTLLFYVWLIRAMRRRLLGEIRDVEAIPLSFRAGFSGGWSGIVNVFRRARHWTPS